MRFLDEYRNPTLARALADKIHRAISRPWTIMEICGGQTHAIVRYGLEQLLPAELQLVHGPGCPVCVTPELLITQAIGISRQPGVILCSFGDMLRVPTAGGDLASARARGADIRAVYSPLDALKLARENPPTQVVFFAVGFETTAPTTAQAVLRAEAEALQNFSVLLGHVRVPPALLSLLSSPESRIDGLLAAGHVCTVMGLTEYYPIAERFNIPVVATGFEPVDLLEGLLMTIEQLEQGRATVANQYDRAVQTCGNPEAKTAIERVFQIADVPWRGLGTIERGGLRFQPDYARFDALRRFDVHVEAVANPSLCRSALVLQGRLKPPECPAFGKTCTPESPLGAPMVSGEGACAAYYRYGSGRQTLHLGDSHG